MWGNSLTKIQQNMLNSIEKRCLAIISSKYVNRKNYLKIACKLDLPVLSQHRDKLLNKFSKKLIVSERYSHWIKPYIIKSERAKRSNTKLHEINCKKVRYGNSTIPSAIKNLNLDVNFKIPKTTSVNEMIEYVRNLNKNTPK